MTYERLKDIAEIAIGRLVDLEEFDGMTEYMKRSGVDESELDELGYGNEEAG